MSDNKNNMSPSDAARIQSAIAKSGGDSGSGSFPARAQSAADKNANAGDLGLVKTGSPEGKSGNDGGSGTPKK